MTGDRDLLFQVAQNLLENAVATWWRPDRCRPAHEHRRKSLISARSRPRRPTRCSAASLRALLSRGYGSHQQWFRYWSGAGEGYCGTARGRVRRATLNRAWRSRSNCRVAPDVRWAGNNDILRASQWRPFRMQFLRTFSFPILWQRSWPASYAPWLVARVTNQCDEQRGCLRRRSGRSHPGVVTDAARRGGIRLRGQALGTAHANEAVEIAAKVSNLVTAIRFREGGRCAAAKCWWNSIACRRAPISCGRRSAVKPQRPVQAQPEVVRDPGTVAIAARSARGDTARKPGACDGFGVQALGYRDSCAVRWAYRLETRQRRQPHQSRNPHHHPGRYADHQARLLGARDLHRQHQGLRSRRLQHRVSNRDFKGTIVSIDSRLDPTTRAITVRAELPTPRPAQARHVHERSPAGGRGQVLMILPSRRSCLRKGASSCSGER